MKSKAQNRSGNNEESLQKNKLEWTVFGVSLLFLVAVISYLGYQALTTKKTPPDLQVSYKKDTSVQNPFRYRIIVENNGGETAEDVMIQAALFKGNEESETAELKIAFSPKRSKREGWINFNSDPSQADSVSIRVVSYKKP